MRPALLVLIFLPGVLHAQGTLEAERGAARSLKCAFPTVTSLDWKANDIKPTVSQQDFGFNLDGIDHKAYQARLIGNLGAVDLAVIDGFKVIPFVETTASGNVNVTTVFAEAAPGNRRFKAVHSRHVHMLGGPLPSQAYGYCRDLGVRLEENCRLTGWTHQALNASGITSVRWPTIFVVI